MVDTCRKPLLEVCDLLDSKRVPVTSNKRIHGPYPYYGANGIQDYVNDYIFDDDLVLLAEDGGNFGSKDKPIAYRVSGKCWVNNHAHVLKPREGLNVDYLCYSLMYYDTKGLVNGATRKKLTQAAMKNIKIPILAYNEQLKIVKRIAMVSTLINNRKKELGLLDKLVKSRFLEMFGDPAVNSKKLPVVKLGDIAFITKLAGFEYTKYIKYQDHGDIIMVRGLNCKSGKLVLDDIYWIDKSVSDLLTRSKLAKGDIVMTYVGTVGEVAIVDKDDTYHLAPNVAKISLYDKKTNNPYFWNYMFTISKNYILRFASTTTQSALGMEKIRKIPFIVPETKDQNRFVGLLTQVDKSKMAVQRSLDELETLKKSLMQTYFG